MRRNNPTWLVVWEHDRLAIRETIDALILASKFWSSM